MVWNIPDWFLANTVFFICVLDLVGVFHVLMQGESIGDVTNW